MHVLPKCIMLHLSTSTGTKVPVCFFIPNCTCPKTGHRCCAKGNHDLSAFQHAAEGDAHLWIDVNDIASEFGIGYHTP